MGDLIPCSRPSISDTSVEAGAGGEDQQGAREGDEHGGGRQHAGPPLGRGGTLRRGRFRLSQQSHRVGPMGRSGPGAILWQK